MIRSSCDVAFCAIHANYFSLGNGCEYCNMDDEIDLHFGPLSPQVQAVLKAAEAWEESGAALNSELALQYAVRAYRDSLKPKPKGVKPEEVEPGTRFRFVPSAVRSSAMVFIRMQEGTTLSRPRPGIGYRREEEGKGFFRFDPEDRIIPLPEEQ
jgi:hypothetical protein